MTDKLDEAIKSVGRGGCNRTEKLELALDIDKKGYDKYKKNVDSMLGTEPNVIDGDTVKLKYTLMIEYFGSVAANLKTIIKLREDGYKVNICADEVNHGMCLIQEVLCHLDTIANK